MRGCQFELAFEPLFKEVGLEPASFVRPSCSHSGLLWLNDSGRPDRALSFAQPFANAQALPHRAEHEPSW